MKLFHNILKSLSTGEDVEAYDDSCENKSTNVPKSRVEFIYFLIIILFR